MSKLGSGSTSETGSISSLGHHPIQHNENNNNSKFQHLPNMETVARNVSLLLEGKPYEEMYELCDFSLADQNDATLAKGVQPSTPTDFKPVIKKSVTYIVAAVLVNEHGDVLMMQVLSALGFSDAVQLVLNPLSNICAYPFVVIVRP